WEAANLRARDASQPPPVRTPPRVEAHLKYTRSDSSKEPSPDSCQSPEPFVNDESAKNDEMTQSELNNNDVSPDDPIVFIWTKPHVGGFGTPPVHSLRELLETFLPTADPAGLDFVSFEDLRQSASKLFFWDYLDGPGRIDSLVDEMWVTYHRVEVSGDLMAFHNRVIENNGAIAEPLEKLYRVDGAREQAWKDVQEFGSILTKGQSDPVTSKLQLTMGGRAFVCLKEEIVRTNKRLQWIITARLCTMLDRILTAIRELFDLLVRLTGFEVLEIPFMQASNSLRGTRPVLLRRRIFHT
ncbi:hypothetical protein BGZ98_008096, partial [Dissophora globulifera]